MRERHVGALVADAEFICGHHDDAAKMDEAQRHIREVMVLHALGRISTVERDRILNILWFAVPSEAPPGTRNEPHGQFDDHMPYGRIS